MARKKKRTYGTGSAQRRGPGVIIHWREKVIQTDGTVKIVHRCEAIGDANKSEVNDRLRERLAATKTPIAVPMKFEEFAVSWKALILPKYPKHSTRKGHGAILEKKLTPFFRGLFLAEITGEHVQQFITAMEAKGYAPHSIHHYHTVLSPMLSMAVSWKRIQSNPAFGAKLPPLKAKRKQHVLTYDQARLLLSKLPMRARLAVAIALMTGARRGELFALRWKCFDPEAARLEIVEAVYDHVIDTPKTEKSSRTVHVHPQLAEMLNRWKATVKKWNKPDDFILAGRMGVRGDQARLLRDYVKPMAAEVGVPGTTWNTFRRTWNTWADEKGVSPKQRGAIVGNSEEVNQKLYTTTIR